MSEFTESVEINSELTAVWEALADIGTIAEWNPGLVGSKATNDLAGVGARRHCVINETQSLDEEVVHFDPLRAITFRITRSTMPFKSANIRFTLAPGANGTIVTVSPHYQMKHGFVGKMLDILVVKRMYRKGMQGLLSGLKEHIEIRIKTPLLVA